MVYTSLFLDRKTLWGSPREQNLKTKGPAQQRPLGLAAKAAFSSSNLLPRSQLRAYTPSFGADFTPATGPAWGCWLQGWPCLQISFPQRYLHFDYISVKTAFGQNQASSQHTKESSQAGQGLCRAHVGAAPGRGTGQGTASTALSHLCATHTS